jgi:hypothetical protein
MIMTAEQSRLADLAQRARAGDAVAAAGFHRELEPQMTHIVRRVLRTGAGRSPLDRRILAEAARTAPVGGNGGGPDQEQLISLVARRLCAAIVAQLQARPRQAVRETVLGF